MLQVKKKVKQIQVKNSKFPPSTGNLPIELKISSAGKNLEKIKVPVSLQDKVWKNEVPSTGIKHEKTKATT